MPHTQININNEERRRLLRERMRRLAHQNKTLMDQIITALDGSDTVYVDDKTTKEETGEPKNDQSR